MPAYRLNAINQCLDAIGESPVSSIEFGVPDAEDASRIIDKVTREVLTAGWSVNSVFGKELTPDIDGVIRVPENILKINTSGRWSFLSVVTMVDPTDSIEKLFKVADQSYQFTEPVTVDIVYYFDIDALPFALQNYIAAKAARTFQKSAMGSQTLDSLVKEDAQTAWTILLDYEAEQEDSNVLTDSPYMRIVTGRNNPLTGR